MTARLPARKHSRSIYHNVRSSRAGRRKVSLMLGLALACFIGLFAFGDDLLGWTDHGGQVQLGLFMSFLFGIICGYRTKG
jgi:hypothetical protein